MSIELDGLLAAMLAERKLTDELTRRMELISEYDATPIVGPVIMFSKTFKVNGVAKSYRYAAILIQGNDRWYLTGGDPRTPQGVTTDELTFWLVSGDYPVRRAEVGRLSADNGFREGWDAGIAHYKAVQEATVSGQDLDDH